MYVITIPANEYDISSRVLYFVEIRYSIVWTINYHHATKFETLREANKVHKEIKMGEVKNYD